MSYKEFLKILKKSKAYKIQKSQNTISKIYKVLIRVCWKFGVVENTKLRLRWFFTQNQKNMTTSTTLWIIKII